MKIVCSSNMPFAKEAFGTLGETVILQERKITASDVRDADILAIRSTTKVDKELLDGSRVRFIGTATIGFNHMDIDYIQSRGIKWCAAAGCNANSVAEYFVAAMLTLSGKSGVELDGATVGVVGVGNVGRLVCERAASLGMKVLRNDPPRARAEGTTGFVTLEQIRAQSDIITTHVPLAKDGPDRTFHMIDADFLSGLKPGCVLMNASRGPVVDTHALMNAIAGRKIGHCVLDVWEGEPEYKMELLDVIDIGTPHIAGHSFEGKAMGTVAVYRQACRFLGVEPSWNHEPLMPPTNVPVIEADASGKSDVQILREIVRRIYDIERDDSALRKGNTPDPQARAGNFDSIRKNYPVRREFRFTTVIIRNAAKRLIEKIISLGFKVQPV